MVEAHNINWQHISASLPYGTDAASKTKRDQLWKGIDVNGNGFVSLAEVDKGLRDVLKIDSVFNCKRAIMRAFQSAKNDGKSKSVHGPDYVERREFRQLLYYLRLYFEYFQAFARIDTGDDNRIDLNEFLAALPQLQKWVGAISNPQQEFKKIDKNDGGQILFDEFCTWAYSKKLDLDDDDD